MRRPTLIALTVVLVTASACGGGSSSSSSSTTSSTSSSKKTSGTTAAKGSSKASSKPTTTTSTSNPLLEGGNHGPGCQFIVAGTAKRFEKPEQNQVVQYLIDAVAAPTGCYDKITFTFDKGSADGLQAPGYTVEYRKKPFGLLGIDGKPIATTTGGFAAVHAVLYVELLPASVTDARKPAVLHSPTYKGNLRLQLKHMKHVKIVEWIQTLPPDATPTNPNDDKVVWLIGLDKRRRFTVDFATQPVPHINVLIMH